MPMPTSCLASMATMVCAAALATTPSRAAPGTTTSTAAKEPISSWAARVWTPPPISTPRPGPACPSTLPPALGPTAMPLAIGYTDDVRDTIVYTSIGDSGTTAATWDQIFQFDRAQSKNDTTSDKIDLRLLDADSDSGDQAFRFVTEFTSPKGNQADGQIRVVDTGSDVNVEIDLNGDNTVDSVIQVMNVDTLTINDFLL